MDHSRESLKAKDLEERPTANSTQERLPLERRVRYDYDDIDDITNLDTFCLYVPTKRNNPLFDAFFLEQPDPESHVIVWVFQMTIAKDHGASGTGFKLLQKLERKLSSLIKDRTVEFRYVLVAPIPFGVSRQAVNWHMPMDVQPNQVFVLYLDLSSRKESFDYGSLGFKELGHLR